MAKNTKFVVSVVIMIVVGCLMNRLINKLAGMLNKQVDGVNKDTQYKRTSTGTQYRDGRQTNYANGCNTQYGDETTRSNSRWVRPR